jgi:two-component system, NarL family, nitrate/nitrite response regulator NarL
MNDEHCRVLLIDNHPLFRRGVAQLIQAEPDFEVVGEATSAEEGVLLAASLKPDLVLMDLNMPHSSGLDALKQIKESGLERQVIMLIFSFICFAASSACALKSPRRSSGSRCSSPCSPAS